MKLRTILLLILALAPVLSSHASVNESNDSLSTFVKVVHYDIVDVYYDNWNGYTEDFVGVDATEILYPGQFITLDDQYYGHYLGTNLYGDTWVACYYVQREYRYAFTVEEPL